MTFSSAVNTMKQLSARPIATSVASYIQYVNN